MKKIYIFGLELYDGYIKKNIGYFNKIEGLTKTKDYKTRMKKIRLYDGIFIEPYLYKDISKDNPDFDIVLYDINANRITSFYMGNTYNDEFETLYNKNFTELIIEGETLFCTFDITPSVMSLWLERRKGVPTKKDTWLKLSRSQRKEWLGQICSDNRIKNTSNTKIENQIVEIDGKNIDDEISFYFAFGEAVYGAGGYMGSNIHALDDCLSDVSGLTLIWNNFEISKKGFYNNKSLHYRKKIYKNNQKDNFRNILDELEEQKFNLEIHKSHFQNILDVLNEHSVKGNILEVLKK